MLSDEVTCYMGLLLYSLGIFVATLKKKKKKERDPSTRSLGLFEWMKTHAPWAHIVTGWCTVLWCRHVSKHTIDCWIHEICITMLTPWILAFLWIYMYQRSNFFSTCPSNIFNYTKVFLYKFHLQVNILFYSIWKIFHGFNH